MDDHRLIEEIKAGSSAAMEVLIRNYYKEIFAFVYRKTGEKNTAADLTQEIFIKMTKKINSYTNQGTFKSWLFTIAVNHCRDYWRSALHRERQQSSELDHDKAVDQQNVSYIFEKKETREQIKRAISFLPENQKEAVLLKYFHELKIKEIAEITDTNLSTVKSRLRQGLYKLKSIIEERGGFFEDEQCKK